jgi:predicted SprT family Zn-dependent metalloprotease
MNLPMSTNHNVRYVCSCGKVLLQCRCLTPKTDKVVQDGCTECKAKVAVQDMRGKPL